jgi:hypothetical protein
MNTSCRGPLALFLGAALPAAAQEGAVALLSRAVAAFEDNRKNEKQLPTTGHRLVKDVRTTAKEFGAGSQLRFDK